MRFVFCAACICYILDDWSGMDIESMVNFILKSIVSFPTFVHKFRLYIHAIKTRLKSSYFSVI